MALSSSTNSGPPWDKTVHVRVPVGPAYQLMRLGFTLVWKIPISLAWVEITSRNAQENKGGLGCNAESTPGTLPWPHSGFDFSLCKGRAHKRPHTEHYWLFWWHCGLISITRLNAIAVRATTITTMEKIWLSELMIKNRNWNSFSENIEKR